MEVTRAVRPVVGAIPVGIDGDRDVQRPKLKDEGCALDRNVSLDRPVGVVRRRNPVVQRPDLPVAVGDIEGGALPIA